MPVLSLLVVAKLVSEGRTK